MDLDDIKQRLTIIDELQSFNQSATGQDQAKLRQARWQKYLESAELEPAEYLVPRIAAHCDKNEPAFIADNVDNPDYSADQVQQVIDEMAPWGFYFRFKEDLTTEPADERQQDRLRPRLTHNRSIFRSHLITNTVATLLGDELSQTSVLDLGCNCGFFSFDIAYRGAKQVTGVELREENLARAAFLQKYYGINNVTFNQGDALTYDPGHNFDVVYNLGLLYHVVDPVKLIERTYALCNRFAIIDTVCRREPMSAFVPIFGKNTDKLGAGKRTVEFHPTYRAVVDTMNYVGFKQVMELHAVSGKIAGKYANHTRRCLIGFK